MPNCVVKGCKNQTSRDKKQDGITFHTFPKRDQNIKEKWIAVICDSRKQPSWQPTIYSVVCSAHFISDDLYYTKEGLRRVVKNGYPKILPSIIEGSDNVNLSQPPSVKEEPADPDLSNDLKLSQSSSSCAQEEPAAPDMSNDLKLSQPSSSCAVRGVQLDSANFDTPRKHKLRQRVLLLEKTLKKQKTKIKTLNQKVRRLHKRNKSLREIIDNLIKQK